MPTVALGALHWRSLQERIGAVKAVSRREPTNVSGYSLGESGGNIGSQVLKVVAGFLFIVGILLATPLLAISLTVLGVSCLAVAVVAWLIKGLYSTLRAQLPHSMRVLIEKLFG